MSTLSGNASFVLSEELLQLSANHQFTELQKKLGTRSDPNTIYLLRKTREDLHTALEHVGHVFTDVDGTLTEVGADELPEKTVEALHALGNHLPVLAVTGRHLGQMNVLRGVHKNGMGFKQAIIESGAYEMCVKSGNVKHLLADENINLQVQEMRTRIEEAICQHVGSEGYTLQKTCEREGEHHRSFVSLDVHKNGEKITDAYVHHAIVNTLSIDLPEGWTLTSSSIGTIECSHQDVHNKFQAMYHWLRARGQEQRMRHAAYFGDGNNDLPVFGAVLGIRAAVINPHTPLELIAHADIATVGPGNAGPMLQLMHAVRSEIAQIEAA